MDLVQPPTKPPRGVKNSKETSGLLMTVIRTLSTSDSNEQRDQERMKLERDYKKSNQHLEHLVSIHHDDLTRVMNLFGRLSGYISHSKENVHAAKENLLACKKLLTCRREELKKLWVESTENKYTLQLLNEIEQMKDTPSQVVSHISQKEYLNATRLLISAINTSETTLKDVVGLQELKSDFELKKQELYAKIVNEVKEQIYVQSTFEIIALKRQGSARNSVDQNTSLRLNRPDRKNTPTQARYRSKKLLNVSNNVKNKTTKCDTIQYSEDPEYTIGTLMECVIMLGEEKNFLEEMKSSVQRELTNLTVRTTKEYSSNDTPNILLEFLQVIMEQLKRVIDCHSFMLNSLKTKHNVNSVYDLSFVWLKMQHVLQHLVSQYVDIQEIKKSEPVVSESCDKVPPEQFDINSYFVRKKQLRTVKGTLFKFDNAGQRDGVTKTVEKEAGKDKQLLCKPSSSNLTQIYVPLSRFAEEIERQVQGASDRTSKLSVFLNELIGQMFRGKRYEDIVSKLNIYDRSGCMLPTKEVNGSSSVSPNPLLTALNTSVIYTHTQ